MDNAGRFDDEVTSAERSSDQELSRGAPAVSERQPPMDMAGRAAPGKANPAAALVVGTPDPVAPPVARKRKPPLVFGLIALVIVLAGGLYGWHWYTVGRFQEVTDDAFLQADKVTIAPKVGGFIAQVLVSDNQRVKAGQVLARVDDRDYRIALSQMKADAEKQKASLAGVLAAIGQQKAAVDQSRAELRNAEAALQFSQQEFARAQNLVRTGSGTVQRVQQAQSDLSQRRATLDKDRAALLGAQKQVAAYESLAASTRASFDRAQVNIEQANLNLDYTTITSPIDGVVGDRSLRVGQLVQPGTNLLTVVPMGRDIYLVANFKETQLTHMVEGQPVAFTVDAYPDHVFHGTVQSMSPGTGAQFALLPPENATGNFTKVVQRVPVKVVLADDPLVRRLRPGLSVEATVETREAPGGADQPATRVGMRDAD